MLGVESCSYLNLILAGLDTRTYRYKHAIAKFRVSWRRYKEILIRQKFGLGSLNTDGPMTLSRQRTELMHGSTETRPISSTRQSNQGTDR